MFIDRSRRPGDVPAPPTPDEVAAGFPVPLLTLVGQDTVEEASAGTESQTSNGRVVMEAVTLSYTLWRNPEDHEDPTNLAELPEDIRASLDITPPWPLPPWIVQWRARMRYPLLWDAVRTTWVSEPSDRQTPAATLLQHANYILMNTFREERMRGGFPGELAAPLTEEHIEHGIPIMVDGVEVAGMRVDGDPHVFGVAADLGGRILTAVFAREHLPFLTVAFKDREPPTAG